MKFLSLMVLASAASASYLDAVNARRSPDAVEARQPHGPDGGGEYDPPKMPPKMVVRAARAGPGDDDVPTMTRVVARKAHGPDGDDDHEMPKKKSPPRRRQVAPPKPSTPPMDMPGMPPAMPPAMPGMPGMGHDRRQAPPPPKPSNPPPKKPGMLRA